MGTAIVINLSPVVPRQLLTVDDLAPFADHITPGARILLRTDWHRRYGTTQYRDELPRISLELAQWLVSRQVALIGVEPPSVADVNNMEELTSVHQTLFRGNVVIVEGLAYLDQITSREVQFVALPLKIVNGDGSPVRAIAIEGEPQLSLSETEIETYRPSLGATHPRYRNVTNKSRQHVRHRS
jgi:kynurenine formamidase